MVEVCASTLLWELAFSTEKKPHSQSPSSGLEFCLNQLLDLSFLYTVAVQ